MYNFQLNVIFKNDEGSDGLRDQDSKEPKRPCRTSGEYDQGSNCTETEDRKATGDKASFQGKSFREDHDFENGDLTRICSLHGDYSLVANNMGLSVPNEAVCFVKVLKDQEQSKPSHPLQSNGFKHCNEKRSVRFPRQDKKNSIKQGGVEENILALQNSKLQEKLKKQARTHSLLVSIVVVFALSWFPLNALNIILDLQHVFEAS